LEMQRTLQDRRLVYDTLQAYGVPVPQHVYVNRDGDDDENVIEEFDDHIVINGTLLKKPFVEKPVDADDHNVSTRAFRHTVVYFVLFGGRYIFITP
jgi:inositol-hexakisphosphate/diphosphoinositol-pentakisphosphate 1-kinase